MDRSPIAANDQPKTVLGKREAAFGSWTLDFVGVLPQNLFSFLIGLAFVPSNKMWYLFMTLYTISFSSSF